ncbi:uncharacterized, partial [Tachysurus ichikawai]
MSTTKHKHIIMLQTEHCRLLGLTALSFKSQILNTPL